MIYKSLIITSVIFLGFFNISFADQTDSSSQTNDANNTGNYYMEVLAPGASGSVGEWTIKTTNASGMASTGWTSGYFTLTQCDSLDAEVAPDVNVESSANCNNRTRHQATSVSYSGDDVTFEWSGSVTIDPSKRYIMAGYFGGFVSGNNYYGTSAGTYQGEYVDVDSSPVKRTYYVTDGLVEAGGAGSTVTRITDIQPENNELISSSGGGATTTLAVEWYVNADDLGFFNSIRIDIEQTDQNYLYGFSSLSPYTFTEYIVPVAGDGSWSEAIWLPDGNYKISAQIGETYVGGVFRNPFETVSNNVIESQDESNLRAQYRQYTVGTSTTIGSLRQNANNQLENILSATGTGATLADCNILSGFDFGNCVAFSLIPSNEQLTNFGNVVSTNIFTKFPVGYVWSIASILNATTTTALPVISAVVPNGIPGSGAELTLALTPGVIDYVLYATTSQFTNVSAPSGASLYSITSFYWNILVYLGVFAYLISRILGSHLIGSIGEMLGTPIGAVDYKDRSAHGRKVTNIRGQSYREYNNADIRRMIKKGENSDTWDRSKFKKR